MYSVLSVLGVNKILEGSYLFLSGAMQLDGKIPLKRWDLSTKLHEVTPQKTILCILSKLYIKI
jgi:hypothetical protein